MASFWNFVARLTSRRRKEQQRSPPTPGAEQQGDATPPAAGAVPGDAARLSEPPRPGAIAGEPGKAVDAVDVAVEPEIPTSLPVPQAAARRRQRNRATEATAGRQLANASTVTAQAISLDDEIKLLRSELIRKLRLQNAQLMTMLERFER